MKLEETEQCGASQCELLSKYCAGYQTKRDEMGVHLGRIGKRK